MYVWLYSWLGEVVFWICVLVCIYFLHYWVLCFCVFVVGCGFSVPNKDIVRFRCWAELYSLFAHNFCGTFSIILSFSLVWGCLYLFDWFLIPIYFVTSLYISRTCIIGHLSIVWFSAFYDNSSHMCDIVPILCTWTLTFDVGSWNLFWGHSTWSFDFCFFFLKRKEEKNAWKIA